MFLIIDLNLNVCAEIMAGESWRSIPGPECISLGRLKDILPSSPSELLRHITDHSVLGPAFCSQLTTAAENLFTKDYTGCMEVCNVLLDKTWEKLNTGYWKDVDINWRYAYTLLCILKALSQCALLGNSQSNIDHTSILKTCDMGLLMGAPIMDNILAKMSRKFQESFGHQRPGMINEDDVEDETSYKVHFSKKARTGGDGVSEETNGEPEKLGMSVAKEREVPRCSCPSVEMFNAMFFDLQHPVVITGAIGYWPALNIHKWSLEYLQKIAGSRTVPVEVGTRYTEEDWTQKLMTIQEFIEEFIDNPKPEAKGYLAQHNLFDQVLTVLLLFIVLMF